MDGVLNLYKPPGPTSHDMVSQVRRIIGQKKVGHAGTLDPPASGVLVICLGEATRIVEYLRGWRKTYRAVAVFGAVTDTEDATGKIVAETDASHISKAMVEETIKHFIGNISQSPPMVSAVHYKGRRLYELARAGQVVERAPRTVQVYSISLLDFQPGRRPEALLEVECSGGTYIRTLCTDIGRRLGCGGYLSSLVRTAVGAFKIEDSIPLEKLENLVSQGNLAQVIHTTDEVLSTLPVVELKSEEEILRVIHGNPVPISLQELPTATPADCSPVRIKSQDGHLLAIGQVHPAGDGTALLHPRKVFRLQVPSAQS